MIAPPLYLIADRTACKGRPLMEVVEAALRAGVRWIQYREKELTRRARYEQARMLHDATRAAGAALIINDELDLAVAVEAEGLHLGQDDLPVSVARRHLGGDRFIGLSTHTVDEARDGAAEGVDYIGVGPIFETRTKDTREPIGVEAIHRVCAAVSVPVVAIGGITPGTTTEIIRAGAASVAVLSSICGSDNIPHVVAQYQLAIGQAQVSQPKNA